MPTYTEGICADGAAILKDGIMMPIEEILAELNAASLPSIEEAGDIAAGMCVKLDEREQAFFIAGFQECIKYLKSA